MIRKFLIVFCLFAIVLALTMSLRHCQLSNLSTSPMSHADSIALAEFEEQVIADSLRLTFEREARYQYWLDSVRAVRKNKGLSRRAREYLTDKQKWDSIRANRPEKIAEGTTINLSSADTTTLKTVPLIGSARAKQIISYRERLGGYISVDQLKEIANMPPEMTRWFTIDHSAPIRKLRINHDDFPTLVSHPYLCYEQVKEIMNYRRKIGPIKSWSNLKLSQEFTTNDFERLTPYISFD